MKTRSALPGAPVSAVEIRDLSANGFLLVIGDDRLFVPFDDFPWFRDAPVKRLVNVEQPHAGHLHWPDLDIDLAVESIRHPERFPLVQRTAR